MSPRPSQGPAHTGTAGLSLLTVTSSAPSHRERGLYPQGPTKTQDYRYWEHPGSYTMVPGPVNPIRSQGGYPPTHPTPIQTSVNPGTTPEYYTNSLGAQKGQTQTPLSAGGTPTPLITPPPTPVLNPVPPWNPVLIVPYLKMDYHKPLHSPVAHPTSSSPTHPGIRPGTVMEPFTNSPISQVGLLQTLLGPWRVPTNLPHPYPTRCKSWYRLRPHNNRPGLSQPRSHPRRDTHQHIPSPTQPSINPGIVPYPSTIVLVYTNPSPSSKVTLTNPPEPLPNPV